MKGKVERAVGMVDESLPCFDVVQVGHILFVPSQKQLGAPEQATINVVVWGRVPSKVCSGKEVESRVETPPRHRLCPV